MVVEEFQTVSQWLFPGPDGPGALALFVLKLFALCLLGFIFCYLVSAVRRGPVEGFYAVARTIATAYTDLKQTSLRRTLAMARLAVQESLRRRVLVAFAVFVVILLFAGWFLDVKSDNPARLYLSFVLTTTNYLIVILALFLSTFSLPNDIKNRTIYTVVTKPVRPGEIVLGRILGFCAIGTALVVVMCLVSYAFVVRGLQHTHEIDPETLAPVASSSPEGGLAALTGETSSNSYHRHRVTINAEGTGVTDTVMGHRHSVRRVGEGASARYELGPPTGMLQARVPVYGKLAFRGRDGQMRKRGINVGHEWNYRSYLEGGTTAAAIWTFEDVTPRRFPKGLPLEMTIRVFRTHKGDIERGVLGAIVVRNPDPASRLESAPISFTSREFSTDQLLIPRQLQAIEAGGDVQKTRKVDLFADLTHNGRVEVMLKCAERGQYFGAAQADIYLRAADSSFFLNFVKGYAGIWLQMVLVTCFGVMFSTFLSGAVAMMSTFASIVLGYFGDFVAEVATGQLEGGGPVESMFRLVTQKNVSVDLDQGAATNVVQSVDVVLMLIMRGFATLLPDFEKFNTVAYVAYGFNIYGGLLARHCFIALGYFLVICIISYFFLKTREIAA